MKTLASLILLLAVAAVGFLFWQGQTDVKTAEADATAESRVEGLAMTQPEVLPKSQAAVPAAPVPEEEKQDRKAFTVTETAEPVLVPLTAETLADVRCVVTDTMNEKQLPTLRQKLETLSLVGLMRIEAVPAVQRYAVYLGPYDRRTADAERAKLETEGMTGVTVAELKRDGYAVVVKTFEQGKDAELWSKDFAQSKGLRNVKLTRLSEAVDPQIKLAFPGIASEQAGHLLKTLKGTGLKLYVCPAQ